MTITLPLLPASQTRRPHEVGYVKVNDTYLFPELQPLVGLKSTNDFILEIKGIKYHIHVSLDDWENPETGNITFTPTVSPLSSFLPAVQRTADLQLLLDAHRTNEFLTVAEKAEVDAYYATTNYKAYAFGQPTFIQGEVYPNYNGKPVYPLLILETGWGDCGNINIFIAIENDKPVAAYIESSCC